MTIRMNFSTDYDEQVGAQIAHGIRSQRYQVAPEFWHENGEPVGRERVNITLCDDTDNLMGGLIGSTFFGGLHIHWLWVDEAHRHQGHGRRLMEHAISIAKERGCTFAWFDTWEVQGAYTFYEKLGAKVIMRMENFPQGSSLIHYRLDFD